MMRSPYDGLSRRPLRVGLAVVGAATVAFETSAFRAGRRGFGVARSSPAFLLWIGERPAVVAILALAGVAALFLFARRPAAILPGSIALLVMASLSDIASVYTFELVGWHSASTSPSARPWSARPTARPKSMPGS